MLNSLHLFVVLSLIQCLCCFDPYATLNLSRHSNHSEIKKAFKHLSLLHHPDKGDKHSQEKYFLIIKAYEVLRDPERRKLYDLLGLTEGHSNFHSSNHKSQWDPNSEFYNDIFDQQEQGYEEENRWNDGQWETRYYTDSQGKIKVVRVRKSRQLTELSARETLMSKLLFIVFTFLVLVFIYHHFERKAEGV